MCLAVAFSIVQDGWNFSNIELLGQSLVLVNVYHTKPYLRAKLFGTSFVLWFELFTKATPWGSKIDEPDFITLQNDIFKVTLGQLNYGSFILGRGRHGNWKVLVFVKLNTEVFKSAL